MRVSHMAAGLTIVVANLASCRGSVEGECEATKDCAAGSACVDQKCYVVCSNNSDCGARGGTCQQGVCRQWPWSLRITGVDGDGAADDDPTHTQHHVDQRLVISGEGLSGAQVELVKNGTAKPLTVCGSNASQATALLPDQVSAGTYSLRVSSQAGGSCEVPLQLLEGSPGAKGDTGLPSLPCTECVDSASLAVAAVGPASLADGAVDSRSVKDGSVSFADLGASGCADGQVMKRVGGAWVCGPDYIQNQSAVAQSASLNITGNAVIGGKIKASNVGVVYVRWGRTVCPPGNTLVYEGIVGGSHQTHSSGANRLCLTKTPTWDVFNDANQDHSLIYGAEYETSGSHIGFGALHDYEVPCAVCLVEDAGAQFIYPGSQVCPSGWTTQYAGYLMGQHYTQTSGTADFLCVDRAAEAIGSNANGDGSLFYSTEGECGVGSSLPCPPYVNNREITCSVCTR